MKVRELMTQPPELCRLDTSLTTASRRMQETGCGTLAVIDSKGRLAGILTDRDLAMAVGLTPRDISRVPVDKAMTHHVHTCAPDDDVDAAMARMAAARIRRLPVVDSDGDVKGLISIDDIILWGVSQGGVTMQALTGALRAICSPRTIRAEPEMPRF
jgi:CBS domain-containing protein